MWMANVRSPLTTHFQRLMLLANDYSEFDRLMSGLEDWYRDSVQAQSYDGHPGSHELGHVILTSQPYPGPPWRALWEEASTHDQPLLTRAGIIGALEDELYGLSHGPSLASPASGLHPNTEEWRRAIAQHPGSLREVGRRFGVSHTQVKRLRVDYGRSDA